MPFAFMASICVTTSDQWTLELPMLARRPIATQTLLWAAALVGFAEAWRRSIASIFV